MGRSQRERAEFRRDGGTAVRFLCPCAFASGEGGARRSLVQPALAADYAAINSLVREGYLFI
jgi:hypothetical protein